MPGFEAAVDEERFHERPLPGGDAGDESVRSAGDSDGPAMWNEARQVSRLALPEGSRGDGQAQAVNEAGWIGGNTRLGNGGIIPVLWSPDGAPHVLPLPVGNFSGGEVRDLNDRGQVLGAVFGFLTIGVIWNVETQDIERELYIDLQTPYAPIAFNDSGQIVFAFGSERYLEGGGERVRILDLLPADHGWQRADPVDINADGLIVGEGVKSNGDRRPFLMIPKAAFYSP